MVVRKAAFIPIAPIRLTLLRHGKLLHHTVGFMFQNMPMRHVRKLTVCWLVKLNQQQLSLAFWKHREGVFPPHQMRGGRLPVNRKYLKLTAMNIKRVEYVSIALLDHPVFKETAWKTENILR